jgi:hypothetical protein
MTFADNNQEGIHDFADNSQEGMKHQTRGATQAISSTSRNFLG